MSKITKLFQWSFHQITFTITGRLDLQRNELIFQLPVAIAVFSLTGFQFYGQLDKTSVILFFPGIARFIYSKVNSFEISLYLFTHWRNCYASKTLDGAVSL